MKPLAIGAVLTVVLTLVGHVVWGHGAWVAIASFGVLAVLMQLVAEALVGPAIKRDLPFAAVLKRWGIGMALRFVGIVVLAGAAVADPKVFPPLPAAMGYLGVLLPLLIVETRLLR